MQKLDEIFRTGTPPIADQEGFEHERIRALVAGIIDAQEVVRARSAALYTEWCVLPNVTLDQAAWLLLECNPWKPISWTGLAGEQLGTEHAKVRNRLECEVGR